MNIFRYSLFYSNTDEALNDINKIKNDTEKWKVIGNLQVGEKIKLGTVYDRFKIVRPGGKLWNSAASIASYVQAPKDPNTPSNTTNLLQNQFESTVTHIANLVEKLNDSSSSVVEQAIKTLNTLKISIETATAKGYPNLMQQAKEIDKSSLEKQKSNLEMALLPYIDEQIKELIKLSTEKKIEEAEQKTKALQQDVAIQGAFNILSNEQYNLPLINETANEELEQLGSPAPEAVVRDIIKKESQELVQPKFAEGQEAIEVPALVAVDLPRMHLLCINGNVVNSSQEKRPFEAYQALISECEKFIGDPALAPLAAQRIASLTTQSLAADITFNTLLLTNSQLLAAGTNSTNAFNVFSKEDVFVVEAKYRFEMKSMENTSGPVFGIYHITRTVEISKDDLIAKDLETNLLSGIKVSDVYSNLILNPELDADSMNEFAEIGPVKATNRYPEEFFNEKFLGFKGNS